MCVCVCVLCVCVCVCVCCVCDCVCGWVCLQVHVGVCVRAHLLMNIIIIHVHE